MLQFPMAQSFGQGMAQMPSARQNTGNQANPQFSPLIPIGLSLAGGLLGGMNAPKRLSAGDIQGMFGPQQLAGSTEELYKMLMQSPAFQQIMQGGAQQGSMLRGRLGQQIGRSGLGGTPMANFAKASSLGFGGQLQRQGQTQLFMQALQAAMQNQQSQMGLFAGQQQMPNFGQMLGSSLLGAGAQGFGAL